MKPNINPNESTIYKHNDNNTETIQEKENCKLDKQSNPMTEYNTILADMEIIYNEYREKSDDLYVKYFGEQTINIRKLAKKLEDSGYPLEKICARVSRDVDKYDIDSRRVREALDSKYKQIKHDKTLLSKRGEIASYLVVTNQPQNDTSLELGKITNKDYEPKKAILLANNGSITDESEIDNNTQETIDFSDLKNRNAQGMTEEKEKHLGYSLKSPSPTATNDIHNLPNSMRDRVIANLEERLIQVTEDWKFEVERNKKILSQKIKAPDPILQQENEFLKRQIQNLKTQLENCQQKAQYFKS